ncbi:transposase domain-containing protein [Niastella caeni]|uniref:Transposase domain-containing protein n=1 Tax=Niastella caeni TaxID=2569763 RepID=A0A4S8HE20_9BACT|nr:transposase domain-containing protein [Niastella caeni]
MPQLVPLRGNAAQNVAIIYSLFATCKIHDVNVYEWLKYVLTAMPTFPSSGSKNCCRRIVPSCADEKLINEP